MPAEAMKVALLPAPVRRVFANRNGIGQLLRRFNDPPQFTLRANQVGNKRARCDKLAAPMAIPHCEGPAHKTGGESEYRETLAVLLRGSTVDASRTACDAS